MSSGALLAAVGGQGGVTVPGVPGTLSLANGSTSGTMIDLSWSAPSDTGGGTISGYKIERSTNSGGSWSVLVADTSSTGTTYTNSGLTRLTRYDYRVAAINEKGTGATGNEPYHTTTAEVPGAPGTLSLSAGSSPDTIIDLSWSAPSDDGGASVTGYRIKKDGSVLVADTGSTATTYSATGLTASTSYSFTVAAINSIGTGADGNTPSLTTAATGITATGGTITTYSGYKAHTFTSSGTFSISSNTDSRTIDVLVIGGGGATPSVYAVGGSSGVGAQGGGGGGGYRTLAGNAGNVGNHTVTIGAGGSAGANEGSFSLYEAVGNKGGGGNHAAETTGGTHSDPTYGGSGGGAAFYDNNNGAPTAHGGYGNDGAYAFYQSFASRGGGGGGGGAGGAGTQSTSSGSGGGIGGVGTDNNYRTGSNEERAGGGGGALCYTNSGSGSGGAASGGGANGADGANNSTSVSGGNGDANTGGGAGGSGGGPGTSGSNGGSGIVIIRYAV